MTRPELDTLIDWAAAEGWNPGLHDAGCFYQADPTGFFAGLLDDQLIGGASVVIYDDRYAFIGLFIMKPEYRARSYGARIALTLRRHCGDRIIGCDGVVDRQASYQRMGFEFCYRNVRYEGVGGGTMPGDVVPLSQVCFSAIDRYDQQVFPAPRTAFLKAWVNQPDAFGFATQSAGDVTGYGVLRRCRHGYKLAPLFADGEMLAERLFEALCAQVPGQPVFFDPSGGNPAAIELARRHDMQPMFETARMYLGDNPEPAPHKVWGITSFELG